LGLQSSLRKLGYVPQIVQTDNSAAATRRLGIEEAGAEGQRGGYTTGYLQFLDHYGLTPQSTHVGNPRPEGSRNGNVEAQNGALKRTLKQQLLLRGSRDFADIDAYEAFLFGVLEKRNAGRQVRLAEEVAVVKPVTATALATSIELRSRVSRSSLIQATPYLFGADITDRQRGDRPHSGMDH
jgi:hypothetical protein